MISFHRRVLRILEEGGYLDPAALKDVSAAAGRGESVTSLVLQRKAMTEPDLLGVLCERLSVPPVDLDRVEFQPDVQEWMPEALKIKREKCGS